MNEHTEALRGLLETNSAFMDGTVLANWPKYHNRPGQVAMLVPYPVVNVIWNASEEIERLQDEVTFITASYQEAVSQRHELSIKLARIHGILS